MTEIRELVDSVLAKWTRAESIRLHAGECTAGEVRTAAAVARAVVAELSPTLTSLSSQVDALKAERTNLIETKREQMARLMTERAEMIASRADVVVALVSAEAQRDKAIAKWEAADGMGGAVVDTIRTVLRESGVPQAAFIDDHVANAIVERNIAVGKTKAAEARVAVLEEALRPFAERSKLFDEAADRMGHARPDDDLRPITDITHAQLRRARQALDK